jgi:hypothetical protein
MAASPCHFENLDRHQMANRGLDDEPDQQQHGERPCGDDRGAVGHASGPSTQKVSPQSLQRY